jgi:hypothetical protein
MEIYRKDFRFKGGEDSYYGILDYDSVLSGRLTPVRLEQVSAAQTIWRP